MVVTFKVDVSGTKGTLVMKLECDEMLATSNKQLNRKRKNQSLIPTTIGIGLTLESNYKLWKMYKAHYHMRPKAVASQIWERQTLK